MEIHVPALVDAHDDIDAPPEPVGQVEVRTESAITEQHVPGFEAIAEVAQHGVLPRTRTLVAANGCLQDRARGQTEDRDDAEDREADAPPLARLLPGRPLGGGPVGA